MHILIMSCNTGGGHNSAAAAIGERLAEQGHTVSQVDFLALAGEKTSRLICGLYLGMAKRLPAAFGATYQAGRAVSTADHALGFRSPVYLACARVVPPLERYLRENPCDGVVMTHVFPMLAVTEMKRRKMALPMTVAVSTDYTCVPFFQEQDCDVTLIPSAMGTGEFVQRGLDPDKLLPLGIPVASGFQRRVGQREARRMLGLREEGKWVLIMGGSMGAGHITQLTQRLLRLTGPEVRLTVVCGSNQGLRRRMEKKFGGGERVRILGVTDQVARYMEACDLLYTKPGGITSTEGAVMGIPMVHMKAIPGCESRNRRVFAEKGMSVAPRGVSAQAKAGRQMLYDPESCARMTQAQRRNIAADAAQRVVELLEERVEGTAT